MTGKPAKPYASFPLYAHSCGYWAKRIRGELFYFGSWKRGVTWEQALADYNAIAHALHAGQGRAAYALLTNPTGDSLSLHQLCNFFLESRENRLHSGELTQRSFNDYKRTCDKLLSTFKPTRPVATLNAIDFEAYRTTLSKTLNKVSLGNEINRARVVFKYGFDAGLIDKPVRFGPNFSPPSKRQMRIERADKSSRLFTAAEIQTLLGKATGPLQAMILLGINCGMGNADCGRLESKHLDLKGGWLHFPRPKTGIERRAALWPETVAALKANKPAHGPVFVTKYGQSWYKPDSTDNPVAKEFRKLMIECRLHTKGRGFYSLRHTFATTAGASLDQAAVDLIMGHEPQHISAVYRHGVDPARLRAVANHVRSWLFNPEKKAKKVRQA